MFQKLCDQGNTKAKAKRLTAELTGVHKLSVQAFVNEIRVTGTLTDGSSGVKQCLNITDKLDNVVLTAIDVLVHQEFRLVGKEKGHPLVTVPNIHKRILEDSRIPRMSRDSLRRVLHFLGYKFVSTETNRDALMMNRQDLVAWRKRYVMIHFSLLGGFCSRESGEPFSWSFWTSWESWNSVETNDNCFPKNPAFFQFLHFS